jgi:hypothetical protein
MRSLASAPFAGLIAARAQSLRPAHQPAAGLPVRQQQSAPRRLRGESAAVVKAAQHWRSGSLWPASTDVVVLAGSLASRGRRDTSLPCHSGRPRFPPAGRADGTRRGSRLSGSSASQTARAPPRVPTGVASPPCGSKMAADYRRTLKGESHGQAAVVLGTARASQPAPSHASCRSRSSTCGSTSSGAEWRDRPSKMS